MKQFLWCLFDWTKDKFLAVSTHLTRLWLTKKLLQTFIKKKKQNPQNNNNYWCSKCKILLNHIALLLNSLASNQHATAEVWQSKAWTRPPKITKNQSEIWEQHTPRNIHQYLYFHGMSWDRAYHTIKCAKKNLTLFNYFIYTLHSTHYFGC